MKLLSQLIEVAVVIIFLIFAKWMEMYLFPSLSLKQKTMNPKLKSLLITVLLRNKRKKEFLSEKPFEETIEES